jgi:hypothetical protein
MNLNVIQLNKQVTDLTNTNTELANQLEIKNKANKEIMEQAKADVQTFVSEKETLTKQIEGIKADNIKAIDTLKAEHSTIIEQLKAEHLKSLSQSEKQIQEATQSTGKQAADLVASMGVAVNTVKRTISSELSPAEIKAEFKKMPAGNQRTEYYNKHKAILSKPESVKQ